MTLRTRRPEILHAIVGTAGHVDHGKTELVKRLTGFDTDRLPEEKARGMSIDLGFAPYVLSDGGVVGIVDVPGHRDFIRNMVAGAASIDVLVLVVAADDGIMPQTDEHMRIVQLLRTPRVMAAVTKIDLVGDEARERARRDVETFMGRMGYPGAATVLVSSRTGEGLDEARCTLERLVHEAVEILGQGEHSSRAFRMNVEHVFTIKGHGTVVTGIPLAGEVSLDDTLELLPAGAETGIRAIQTYKYDVRRASSNACTALNLRDVGAESIRRGMTLAAPGAFEATIALVGTLRNATDTVVIRRREQVRFHAGTSVTSASLRLIGVDRLEPGRQAFVHAKLEDPVVLAAGDRFVIRSSTAAFTLGGGAVLTSRARPMRRRVPEVEASLERARESLDRGDLLGAALAASFDSVLGRSDLIRLTQSTADAAQAAIERKQQQGMLVALGEGWLVRVRLGDLAARIEMALVAHHRANPHAWGMTAAHAAKILGIGPKDFDRFAEELSRFGDRIVVQHGCLALRGHRPALSEQQLRAKDELARRVKAAGVHPPARGDLAAALPLSQSEMNLLVRLLCDEGAVTVLRTHVVATEVLDRCRERLLALFFERPVVDVNAFRAATGVSRRVAVEMLEAFDARSLTRRVDDGRVLIRPGRPG